MGILYSQTAVQPSQVMVEYSVGASWGAHSNPETFNNKMQNQRYKSKLALQFLLKPYQYPLWSGEEDQNGDKRIWSRLPGKSRLRDWMDRDCCRDRR